MEFTFKQEARGPRLQGFLDGLDLAGHHAEYLRFNATAADAHSAAHAAAFFELRRKHALAVILSIGLPCNIWLLYI